MIVGGGAHHVDANAHHVARAHISKQFIQLGAADHVGKDDCEFDVITHDADELYLIRSATLRPFGPPTLRLGGHPLIQERQRRKKRLRKRIRSRCDLG